MSGREHTYTDARRDLELVDAILADAPAHGADDRLAELVVALRETRPQPSEEFRLALDTRAATGFAGGALTKRELASDRRPALLAGRAKPSPRPLARRPMIALAVAAIVALAVALPLAAIDRGGGHPGATAGSHAATSAPATATKGSASQMDDLGPAPVSPANAGRAEAAAPASRSVERAATLEVGVSADAIQSAAQRVFALTSSFGGYVRNSNVSSGGASGGGASFDLRVPASRLQAAIAALSGLGHVRAENQTSADVTEGLAYLDRELAAHRAQRTSLLHQLAAMPEGERATALRTRLREVEADLGELQTQLSSLKARIRYTPLQLQLVAERAAGAGGAVGGDLTPGGAASDAGKVLEAALAVLVIAAAAAVPVIAALLLAWGAARLLRTRSRERALDAR